LRRTLPGEASGAVPIAVIASLLGRSKKEGDQRPKSLIRMIDVDKHMRLERYTARLPVRGAEVR
jgi:hypothetical protein